jgi:hypothetical protein
MLFVIEISWKPDKADEFWKRVAKRRVPQHEDVKILEAYYIAGQNRSVAIVEAPNEVAIAARARGYDELRRNIGV